MGRGLSELQQTILLVALDGHERPAKPATPFGTPGKTDVYYAEVLVRHFGFVPKWCGDLSPSEAVRQRPGGQHFDKGDIGHKRYAAAQAATSRAFMRLQERGLVQCVCGAISHWSGGNLTDQGLIVAKALKEQEQNPKPKPR